MTHGALFNGIGGFQLAAHWMGWTNVMHCEIDEFCNKVVKKHFPESIQHGDIKTTDFGIYRGGIDILTGGFPCQPYSTAGKRKGNEDDRHLWPEMLRAIREISPRWVVGENVRGLTNWNRGVVFDQVQADLEAEGYEVLPFLLPAAGIGAPHRRYRIWFIAHTQSSNRDLSEISFDGQEKMDTIGDGSQRVASDPHSSQRCEGRLYEAESEETERYTGAFDAWNIGSAWENFPTQSPVCGGDDGFPDRLDQLKALGNAIVPQIAQMIFKSIQEYEKLQNL